MKSIASANVPRFPTKVNPKIHFKAALILACLFCLAFSTAAQAQECPELIGQAYTASFANGIAVSENYAFVADESGGLFVFNVSDPTSPIQITVINQLPGNHPFRAQGVAVSGTLVYVTFSYYEFLRELDWNGVVIYDFSDISNIQQIGFFMEDSFDEIYQSITVTPSYAYICGYNVGLVILDIADPTNPVKLGSYDTGKIQNEFALSENYIYIACYSDGDNGDAQLHVVDVTDPVNPQKASSLSVPYAFSIAVAWRHAYIASLTQEILILDVSDPNMPTILQNTGNQRSTRIKILDNLIFLSTYLGDDMLLILRADSPTQLTQIGEISTYPGHSMDFELSNTLLFAPQSGSWVNIFSIDHCHNSKHTRPVFRP